MESEPGTARWVEEVAAGLRRWAASFSMDDVGGAEGANDFGRAWDELERAIEEFRSAVAEVLRPIFEAILEYVDQVFEAMRREWLRGKLAAVLPDDWALRLAGRWPKRLLPPLDWVFGKETDGDVETG